jgi:hypothetical protein
VPFFDATSFACSSRQGSRQGNVRFGMAYYSVRSATCTIMPHGEPTVEHQRSELPVVPPHCFTVGHGTAVNSLLLTAFTVAAPLLSTAYCGIDHSG